jgi:hypothetical protein
MAEAVKRGTKQRSKDALGAFGELEPAELALIEACCGGREIDVDGSRPYAASSSNRVRASLIRFLALGGADTAPVHEKGVRLHKAWIHGVLDLDDVAVTRPISLIDCVVERIDARRARLRTLNLHGSRILEGINADALRCEGQVNMRHGFEAGGPVRLIAAQIGVDLDCSSGRFDSAGGTAILLDAAVVNGPFCLDNAHVEGEVSLTGADIRGGLECHGSRLDNPHGDALNCNRAKLASVCLRDGFHATGAVRIENSQVLGCVNCSGGSFDAGAEERSSDGQTSATEDANVAISFNGSRVEGSLILKDVTRIDGILDLADLKVGRLTDDADAWQASRGELILDGFVYGRFAHAPADAASRVKWLDGQLPAHLGHAFRPQPWEQLITVLRSMGYPEEARLVAMEKQRRLRMAGKVVSGLRGPHWLYGALAGYGYRPLRLLVAILCVWLVCAAAYGVAQARDADYFVAAPETETANPLEPLMYSADVLLPLVDFGQASGWKVAMRRKDDSKLPWGWALRFIYWTEIAFGWIAGVLLASAAGTLIKKD